MGRGSVRQNKNKFQLIREDLGLSREKAAELLETVSPERIEKIESGKCAPYPEEVLAFARKYKRPSLCNYYCSQCCPIGRVLWRLWNRRMVLRTVTSRVIPRMSRNWFQRVSLEPIS